MFIIYHILSSHSRNYKHGSNGILETTMINSKIYINIPAIRFDKMLINLCFKLRFVTGMHLETRIQIGISICYAIVVLNIHNIVQRADRTQRNNTDDGE